MICRPYIKKFVPWYSKGNEAAENLAGVCLQPYQSLLPPVAVPRGFIALIKRPRDIAIPS
jgi:hypothetical protein